VAPDDAIARWASKPIELGGGNPFTPWVVGSRSVPEVTDAATAMADPELAVFSVLAHGRDADVTKSVQIALVAMAASVNLDANRSLLYVDLIHHALSDAAVKALQAMNPENYEFQSEFARRYVAQGKAEGKVEGKAEGKAEGKIEGRAEGELLGKAELVIKQLTLKFGSLPETLSARIRTASVADIESMAERLITARTLDEVLR
jgi:predicted transposase YdaD